MNKNGTLIVIFAALSFFVCAERNPFEFALTHKPVEKLIAPKITPTPLPVLVSVPSSGWHVIEETAECLVIKHTDGQIRRISLVKD